MTGPLTFAPDIPADKEAIIQTKLDEIERAHHIKYLFAIESGSRAWGFPSPDSDFDVRFVYTRKEDAYLSLFPLRDVIETPLEGDWDINGWDISKALTLLLKPNPVLLEWMASPIRYRWNGAACKQLEDFTREMVQPRECLTHYYHLLLAQINRHLEDPHKVNLKKYLYAIRPALAIRWARIHPDILPPMNFQELANGTDLSVALQTDIRNLLEAKSRASELGVGDRIASIDSLIEDERAWGQAKFVKKPSPSADTKTRTDALFRKIVRNIK